MILGISTDAIAAVKNIEPNLVLSKEINSNMDKDDEFVTEEVETDKSLEDEGLVENQIVDENQLEDEINKANSTILTIVHKYGDKSEEQIIENLKVGDEVDVSKYALNKDNLELLDNPGTIIISDDKENKVVLNYELFNKEIINRPPDKINKNTTSRTLFKAAAFDLNSGPNPNEPGAVFVDKVAEWTDEENGKATITMTVRGNPIAKGSDVVLVLDKSGSMGSNNRLVKMKSAAKAFINKLYEPTDGIVSDNRVSVVTFDVDAYAYPNAPSGVETFLGVNDTVGGQSSQEYFDTNIDAIVASRGTSYTAGLTKAQEIIDNRTSVNQSRNTYVVFMSDGIPNGTLNGVTQANALKNNGTKIYSLGLGLSGNSFSSFIEPLASDPKTTYAKEISDNSDLTPIFTGIAGEIRIAGTSAVVEDQMSQYFEIDPNANPWYETNSGIVTKNNDKVNWELGDINKEPKTLKLFVKLKDDVTKGNRETNAGATLTYTDYNDVPGKEIIFPSPTLPVGDKGQILMKYYLVNDDGKAIAYDEDLINDFENRIILGSKLYEVNGSNELDYGDYTLTPPAEIEINGVKYEYVEVSMDHGGSDPNGTIELRSNNKAQVVNFGYKAVLVLKLTKVGLYEDKNGDGLENVGDVINYTIEVKNIGSAVAKSISVKDDMLNLDKTVDSILRSVTWVHEQAYPITQNDINNGKVDNTVFASIGSKINLEDKETVILEQTPKIKIFKKADKDFFNNVGEDIEYTYIVTNVGNVILNNIEIKDDKLGEISGAPDSLAPGQSFTLSKTYKAINDDMNNGSVTNIVDVSANYQEEEITHRDSVIVGAKAAPSYEVKKLGSYEDTNGDDVINPGDKVNYTIIIKNNGNIDLKQLAVKDPMINLDEFIDLPIGETWTYSSSYIINQADVDKGQVTNKVIVNDDDGIEITTPLKNNSQISLEKTANKKTFSEVGEKIIYSYKVKNIGNVIISGPMELVDDKLGSIDLSSVSPVLNPGEEFTVTREYFISEQDYREGSVTNIAKFTVDIIGSGPITSTDTETIKLKEKASETSIGGLIFNYKDVEEDCKNHIQYIQGYPNGSVQPEGNITRAEAATMLTRLLSLDISDQSTPDFNDMKNPQAWYNKYINAIVKKGAMQGYPDGSFKPDSDITRAEFAQMIYSLDENNNSKSDFKDIVGHWGEKAINQAYGNKRIDGYPDGSFKPDRLITRAESAKILNRLFDRMVDERGLNNIEEGEINKFNDLFTSHWAYYEIVEATNNHCYYRIKDISKEVEFEQGFIDGLEEVWKSVNHRFWDDINNK
ncbi:MAG: DUF7507 domain-containing protein [Peptoniphilaceae bacterium]